MEQQPTMTWPEQLHENNLVPAPGDDEFSNFLEFNMHFSGLEEHGHGPASHSQPQEHQHSMMHQPSHTATTGATSTMSPEAPSHPQYSAAMDGLTMNFNGHGQVQSHPGPMPYSTPSITPGFCAREPSHPPTMPRQQQSQQPHANQHYMQGQPMIPPTPNSIELHGSAARYPQRVEENPEMYDRYSRVNEEQALYTPLVSPAMTPLENQFRLPEYTIPGEYFTPLTSPALEAQNANSSNNGHPFHARQVSDVGFAPTSAEVNPLPGSSAPPSPSIIRKTNRRRPSTTSRLAGRNKVKQSPSIRAQAQRGRGKPMPPNSEEFYSSLTQELNRPQNNDVRSLQASSNDGSGQDSVSPEPLSEPLMPPPALPPPRKSPAIGPQPSQSPGTAATPATLMRIRRSQHAKEPPHQFTGQAQFDYPDEIMEDISLPEAATPAAHSRPTMSRIDTSVRTSTASPAVSANATPSLEPRAGSVRTPGSVAMSPRAAAMPSPSGPIPKKSEPLKSSLSGRKWPSLSSTQASPQLRPKISPSIQPLMRGVDNPSQDAVYLASKSNYQHILDGTLPSGVSYPETLAENLSSKRTNHKLAEQGRRNRINTALKEIESLIPSEFIQSRQAKETAAAGIKPGEKEKEKASNQAISKASAVEMAIVYIKALKNSLDETTARLAAAEAKLAGNSTNPADNKGKADPSTTASEKMTNGAAS